MTALAAGGTSAIGVDDAAAALRETRAGVEIDWGEGTLAAAGGAAADLRMPSAELARPGALRRARGAALARLRAVMLELPAGGGRGLPATAVERALARARTEAIDYQSNGGAIAHVRVRFTDWADADPTAPGTPASAPAPAPDAGVTPKSADGPASSTVPAPVAVLSVPAMRLGVAPLLRVGKREVAAAAARYRLGAAPPGAGALPARADREGRLVLDVDLMPMPMPALAQKLAHGVLLIYVQKVVR